MLNWFTTIPGILVICGVILLVLALILFILGNKSEKKIKKGENLVVDNNVDTVQPLTSTEVTTNEIPTNEVVAEGMPVSTAPLGDDMITAVEGNSGVIDFTPNNGVDINEVTSEFDFSLSSDDAETSSNTYDFSLSEPAESVEIQSPEITITEPSNDYSFNEINIRPVEEAKVVDTGFGIPAMEPVTETQPVIEEPTEPVMPAFDTPVIEKPTEPVNNDMFATPVVEETPTAMPTIDMPTMEPAVEETPVATEPVVEVPVMEPTVEPVPVVETTEPTIETPTIEPVVEEVAEVAEPTVAEPTIEPVSTVTFEMPTVEIPANDNNQF